MGELEMTCDPKITTCTLNDSTAGYGVCEDVSVPPELIANPDAYMGVGLPDSYRLGLPFQSSGGFDIHASSAAQLRVVNILRDKAVQEDRKKLLEFFDPANPDKVYQASTEFDRIPRSVRPPEFQRNNTALTFKVYLGEDASGRQVPIIHYSQLPTHGVMTDGPGTFKPVRSAGAVQMMVAIDPGIVGRKLQHSQSGPQSTSASARPDFNQPVTAMALLPLLNQHGIKYALPMGAYALARTETDYLYEHFDIPGIDIPRPLTEIGLTIANLEGGMIAVERLHRLAPDFFPAVTTSSAGTTVATSKLQAIRKSKFNIHGASIGGVATIMSWGGEHVFGFEPGSFEHGMFTIGGTTVAWHGGKWVGTQAPWLAKGLGYGGTVAKWYAPTKLALPVLIAVDVSNLAIPGFVWLGEQVQVDDKEAADYHLTKQAYLSWHHHEKDYWFENLAILGDALICKAGHDSTCNEAQAGSEKYIQMWSKALNDEYTPLMNEQLLTGVFYYLQRPSTAGGPLFNWGMMNDHLTLVYDKSSKAFDAYRDIAALFSGTTYRMDVHGALQMMKMVDSNGVRSDQYAHLANYLKRQLKHNPKAYSYLINVIKIKKSELETRQIDLGLGLKLEIEPPAGADSKSEFVVRLTSQSGEKTIKLAYSGANHEQELHLLDSLGKKDKLTVRTQDGNVYVQIKFTRFGTTAEAWSRGDTIFVKAAVGSQVFHWNTQTGYMVIPTLLPSQYGTFLSQPGFEKQSDFILGKQTDGEFGTSEMTTRTDQIQYLEQDVLPSFDSSQPDSQASTDQFVSSIDFKTTEGAIGTRPRIVKMRPDTGYIRSSGDVCKNSCHSNYYAESRADKYRRSKFSTFKSIDFPDFNDTDFSEPLTLSSDSMSKMVAFLRNSQPEDFQ